MRLFRVQRLCDGPSRPNLSNRRSVYNGFVGTPGEAQMVDKARSDPIQKTLARSGLGADLIEEMDKRRAEKSPASPAAPPAPETPPSPAEGEATVAAPGAEVAVAVPAAPPAEIIPVVIEFSTGFPGSAALARAMILKQFLKERPKTTDAGLAKHVVARLKPQNLPATSTPLFAPEDQLAIANSLFTDHYLFGDVDRSDTIGRLGAAHHCWRFGGRKDGSGRGASTRSGNGPPRASRRVHVGANNQMRRRARPPSRRRQNPSCGRSRTPGSTAATRISRRTKP